MLGTEHLLTPKASGLMASNGPILETKMLSLRHMGVKRHTQDEALDDA